MLAAAAAAAAAQCHHPGRQLVSALASALASAARAPSACTTTSSSWAGGSLRLSRRGYADAAEGSAVQEIATAEDYDAVMKRLAENGSLGIIDFTAKWCGPCKAIAPIYEQLSAKYPQVAFMKIDVDNAAMLPVVNDHGITGVPTFTVYKGARKLENFTGARVDLLRAVLQKHAT